MRQRGITLIALVVTIIVLIILAGVSINLLLGDNGLIKQAQIAKETSEMTRLKEEAEMVRAAGEADYLAGFKSQYGKTEILQDLNNYFEGSTLGTDRITTEDGKYDILVDDSLNITVEKSGQTEVVVPARKILIEAAEGERDGKTYIDLIFKVEGMDPFADYLYDYIDNNVYVDEENEPESDEAYIATLEEQYETIASKVEGETIEIIDTEREEFLEIGQGLGLETYERSLKLMILTYNVMDEAVVTDLEDALFAAYIKMISTPGYYYVCDIYNIYKYPEDVDISYVEDQMVELAEIDGDFETLIGYIMDGATIEDLETNAANMGLTYNEYLKYIIMQYGTMASVEVSNGDSFTTLLIDMMDANKSAYEVTKDGQYTFNAQTGLGGVRGQTSITIGQGPVTNPFGENDWELAWVYTDGAWVEKTAGDTLPTDVFTAKLYAPEEDDEEKTVIPAQHPNIGLTLEEGTAYKLVIEGNGEMPPLYIENAETDEASLYAWQNYGLRAVLLTGSTREFYYPSYITEVYVCDGITSICEKAFMDFLSLKNIQISNDVTRVENDAFNVCRALTSIKIPNVTYIGEGAFQICDALTGISIAEGVTTIEKDTFSGCTNLASITIPSTLTSIGERAFSSCESLLSITLPDIVTTIGAHAFNGCKLLANINIPSQLTSIEEKMLYECESLTTITLPNSITSIGQWAFAYCTSLTSITMPTEATYINSLAFEGCSKLESIIIPNGITSCPDFKGCTSLKSVTLPASVTNLGTIDFLDMAANSVIYVPNETMRSELALTGDYDETKTTIVVKQ